MLKIIYKIFHLLSLRLSAAVVRFLTIAVNLSRRYTKKRMLYDPASGETSLRIVMLSPPGDITNLSKVNGNSLPINHSVRPLFLIFMLTLLLASCGSGKQISGYKKIKKFGGEELQEDFTLLRNILEKEHPSLYWYTPKAVMDSVFNHEYGRIKDSMNELQFRNLLSRTVSPVKCGHTSVRSSRGMERYLNRVRLPLFPMGMRLWGDTLVSTYNLYRKDTLLKRGTLIKSINGVPAAAIRDSLFRIVTTDGDADNFKNIRISNNFPYNHFLVFDSSKTYDVAYYDSTGAERQLKVGMYRPPPPDTGKKASRPPPVPAVKIPARERRRLRLESIRRLRVDTAASTAYMDLTSFTGGRQKRFFRKTFRTLRRLHIQHLVLDVRNNGGGLMGNSVALSRYIADDKFKVADTVAAVTRFSSYNRYIKNRFWYGLSMVPFCKKRADGRYHFGWWERHYYKPRRRNHFSGHVYAISGGYSFSATTLFLNAVKGQKNVTIVGEETGGGSYGNSAVYIPEITLPNSKLRVRLPVFRLVMSKDAPKNGRGVIPDVPVGPTTENIKTNTDLKLEKVKELIAGKKG